MSPEDVKRVWDSLPNPSYRRVSEKINLCGGKISPHTVYRYRAAGWRALPRAASARGRPRAEDVGKRGLIAVSLGLAASTNDPFFDLVKELGGSERLRKYLSDAADEHDKAVVENPEMDTADAVRRECNKAFAIAVNAGSKMAADPDIKPKEYSIIMDIVNACMVTINSPSFGMPIAESLRVIEGTISTVEQVDERTRQLRELLMEDAV